MTALMQLHPLILFVAIPALLFFTWPRVRDWFAEEGFPIAGGMKIVALIFAIIMGAAMFDIPFPLLSGPNGDYVFLALLLGFFAYNALVRKGGTLSLLGTVVQLIYGGSLGMGFIFVALLWIFFSALPRYSTWH